MGAEALLPLGVTARLLESATGVGKARIRSLVREGKLSDLPGAPGIVEVNSALAVFGEGLRERLTRAIEDKRAKRRRAGIAAAKARSAKKDGRVSRISA